MRQVDSTLGLFATLFARKKYWVAKFKMVED